MEPDVKPWWASKTMWGGIIAVLAGLAGLYGYKISPEDQARLIELLSSGIALVGGALTVYGRIKATKSIGKP